MAVIIGMFMVIAGVTLYGAFRHARAGNWHRVWTLLLGVVLPFLVAIVLVLWKGPPSQGPAPGLYNRGFGPGWRCVDVPYADFCIRDVP